MDNRKIYSIKTNTGVKSYGKFIEILEQMF